MSRKSVLVTGAGRGIGKAIAIEFAKNGYDVGINYNHSRQAAEEVRKEALQYGADAICIQGDVSQIKGISSMMDAFINHYGKIDVLINNAGLSKFAPFLQVTEELFTELVFTDFRGAFFAAQAAARNMVENHIKGSIINTSSNHIGGCWPDSTVYASAKAALTQFTKNAALELAPYRIRVNAIAPGYTDVKWTQFEGIYEAVNRIPLQRFAEPEEIAKVILFMASEDNLYMTGSCVLIDGGALLPVVADNAYMK